MNSDVTVLAKLPDEDKAISLGVFTIDSNSFNKNHGSLVVLKSLLDSVNIDNICSIVEKENAMIRFLAVLELPDNNENKEG